VIHVCGYVIHVCGYVIRDVEHSKTYVM